MRSTAIAPLRDSPPAPALAALPAVQIGHFLSLCDDTGLLQHALHSVPDRSHGYCTDDNARALLVVGQLSEMIEHPLGVLLTSRFAAFLQHAWNGEARRFRNFLSFDRRWLEEVGSQDSHGRALWALGECAQSCGSRSLRQWAVSLFVQALPTVEDLDSPRAWSFALLGLQAYCAAVPEDVYAQRVRIQLADRLMALLAAVVTPDWQWFEQELGYDNARLPQALIVTGSATDIPTYVSAGMRSLRWLLSLQTAPAGTFRPVGSQSFGAKRLPPQIFDQQPLEATATISACASALGADGDAAWRVEATRAFAWFLGSNDLSLPLVDLDTGSCRDGLHPDRANENRGAESAVSYLLALAQMRELTGLKEQQPKFAPRRAAND